VRSTARTLASPVGQWRSDALCSSEEGSCFVTRFGLKA
jgi:hypothetical protein